MQSRSPLLEELAKAMENALGVAQAAGEEARAVVRAQADRLVAELDLVRREEFEALKTRLESELAALRGELSRITVGAPGDLPPKDDAG